MSLNKKAIFICQLNDDAIRIAKWRKDNSLPELAGIEAESILPHADDKNLLEKTASALKKLKFSGERVIISLPRSKAACRYLKVPSKSPKEIGSIVSLQASTYLPYPASELITGYQIISTDKQGYSHINLTIVHRPLIERLLKIFKELRANSLVIVLNSYGVNNLYNYVYPDAAGAVMVIDADDSQAELIITEDKKLVFSRSFKLNYPEANWQGLFLEDVRLTQDAYCQEVSKEKPLKVFIVETDRISRELIKALSKEAGLQVELLNYRDKIGFAKDASLELSNYNCSLSGILGLGLKDTEESLYLLPPEIKEKNGILKRNKERFKIYSLGLAALLIFTLGVFKSMDNKNLYLKKMKAELNSVSSEGRALEDMEKRLSLVENHLRHRLPILDIIRELYQSVPADVTFSSLNYEEDKQIVLRGASSQLNSVFTLIAVLEKSPVFGKFSVKVRYATKKRESVSERIDFEIACLKER